MAVRYKGKLLTPKYMSKEELGDYLWKMKATHPGYGQVAREYMRKTGRRK